MMIQEGRKLKEEGGRKNEEQKQGNENERTVALTTAAMTQATDRDIGARLKGKWGHNRLTGT